MTLQRLKLTAAPLVVLAMLITFYPVGAAAAWNIPWPRPARYDYTQFYAPDLQAFVQEHPGYFAAELAKGWAFYKDAFIMSNGLVNHQRGVGVGENEAVSEGQGYGMLLAALNNDQSTFNRVFEAANQYLWRDDKKSYFIWDWPANAQGAATDADLDIGLALVFADTYVQRGFWTPYQRNGITYRTRALEVIGSIRTNMCEQNYLLPGDNWGGSALDNQNPSYYATATMRVFNAYQNQHDFTPVIANCYKVLRANTQQYARGQAPDWCTRSGARAGGRSRDMGYDAIRTPWRIAKDALWFGTEDARQFCSNSRMTITQYANSDTRFALAQMGHYTENGSLIEGTGGSFDNVAMWSCGILGSLDVSYTSAVMTQRLIGQIVGRGNSFGDASASDHVFYFKQSLGLLGFALITGQFPNPLDEPGVTGTVATVAPASVAPPSVSVAGEVTFLVRFTAPSLTITSHTVPAFDVMLHDLQGKLQLTRTGVRSGTPLSIAGLRGGRYLVTVRTQGQHFRYPLALVWP